MFSIDIPVIFLILVLDYGTAYGTDYLRYTKIRVRSIFYSQTIGIIRNCATSAII
jgi:hypothetical protein